MTDNTSSRRCFDVSVIRIDGLFIDGSKKWLLYRRNAVTMPTPDELGRPWGDEEAWVTAEAELFTEAEVREIQSVWPEKDRTVESVLVVKVNGPFGNASGDVIPVACLLVGGKYNRRIEFAEGELFSFPVGLYGLNPGPNAKETFLAQSEPETVFCGEFTDDDLPF